jgi:hypothetical protein
VVVRATNAGQTGTVGGAAGELESRPRLWHALRADPRHAAELCVLHAFLLLSPHAQQWWQAQQRRRPDDPPDVAARRVLRRSVGVARRGGIVTGSSFYVGMAPAMAMIYLEQLAMVLRIAAVYGRDPSSPGRVAEILVVQGRHAGVPQAATALRSMGRQSSERRLASDTRTVTEALRQLPSMVGLRLRRGSGRSPFDLVVAGAQIASYFVPVVSIPVWAISNARATRRLGRAAIEFYRQPPSAAQVDIGALPTRPKRRTRRTLIATVVPLGLALSVLVTLALTGSYAHHLRWVALALAEASLLLIFVRVIHLTRTEASSAPAPA